MESKINLYYTTISGVVKDRYDEKMKICGGIDPYMIKSNELSEDPNDFPKISMEDIENYMIHTVSPFTNKFYNNYKGTEAHSFFESGFVLQMGSKKSKDSAIIRGKVMC